MSNNAMLLPPGKVAVVTGQAISINGGEWFGT
jgi:hypothetical protein